VLFLHQTGKIQEILHDFGCTNVKPIGTPIEPRLQLYKLDMTENEFLNLPYHSAIGQLSYLAHSSRPDIAFTGNALSRHMNGYN